MTKEEMRERFEEFLQDFMDESDDETSIDQLKLLSFKHLLESQEVFLKFYHELLNNKAFSDDEDDSESSMNQYAKAAMKAYLDTLNLWRKNRKTFFHLQTELVRDYVDVIKDISDRLDEKLSDSDSRGGRKGAAEKE